MGQPTAASTPAIFVSVVEHASIRGAARALGIPKSNVSRRITELEAHLGVRLLQRTTRQLRLTDAGTSYFRGASTAVSALHDAEREVRALQAEPRGLLRVTAPNNFGREFLVPIVLRFMREHPAVEVSLVLTDRMVELVEERFDVAIRGGPLPDSTLVAHKLGTTAFVTVASAAHVATHGRVRAPEDLASRECLIHGDTQRASWRYQRGRKGIDVRVRGRFSCTSFHALHDAARDGLGIARVPILLAQPSIERGELVRMLDRFEPPDSPIHIVYPSQRHLAPKVRAFIDLVSGVFADAPWSVTPKKTNKNKRIRRA